LKVIKGKKKWRSIKNVRESNFW